jgi:hypothetical protein
MQGSLTTSSSGSNTSSSASLLAAALPAVAISLQGLLARAVQQAEAAKAAAAAAAATGGLIPAVTEKAGSSALTYRGGSHLAPGGEQRYLGTGVLSIKVCLAGTAL